MTEQEQAAAVIEALGGKFVPGQRVRIICESRVKGSEGCVVGLCSGDWLHAAPWNVLFDSGTFLYFEHELEAIPHD